METEVPRRKPRWRRRLLLLAVLVLIGVWYGRDRVMTPAISEGSYVLLPLEGAYPEMPPDGLFDRVLGEGNMPLLDLVHLIRDAGDDGRVAGLVLRVRALDVGWAKAQDIRDALLEFRGTGKPLIAFLENEVLGGLLGFYVASAASQLYVPPGATAPLTGLAAEYTFLGGVWEKLDIDMHVEKIREYKTAGDFIANKEMSPYHREMANALLDSIFDQVVAGIAAARSLEPAGVRAAIDRCPITATELVDNKLADGERFLDEVRTELVGADGGFLSAQDYRRGGGPPRTLGEGTIAVVYAAGTIVTGDADRGPFQTGMVGSDTMIEALRDAVDDDEVRAIVLRVDSPGGSAYASDVIWRATQQARERKPLIVSMSDVAASGGYYVAAGATRILAQPGTLTGSIGVVAWKPNLDGFLNRLGIHTESVSRGKFARMLSLTSSPNEAERARMGTAMNHIYDLFVARVSAGRSLSATEVNQVGRGRVWTGEQAKANGLVDEIGGFAAALRAAKAAAGIAEDERIALSFYPRRKSVAERLAQFFQTRALATAPPWWQRLSHLMPLYDFPDGSILALMPELIRVR